MRGGIAMDAGWIAVALRNDLQQQTALRKTVSGWTPWQSRQVASEATIATSDQNRKRRNGAEVSMENGRKRLVLDSEPRWGSKRDPDSS